MELLRAVNEILPTLGEHHVSSLDVKHPTVQLILNKVRAEQDALMTQEWWFNTTWAVPLYPGPDGVVTLPVDTLSVRTHCTHGVQRGSVLVNSRSADGRWPVGQAVQCTYQVRVPFEQMPESAAQVVWYSALVATYLTDIGMEQVVREWQQYVNRARTTFEAEHLRNMQYSTQKSARFRRLRAALRR